ncbi:type II toxin-antitoxin system prevent-host-death family antitoxin [Nonomuraea terrae]|uniref:type II toxin-antitoxin system prevent-host-death family antitoxin n=1 Tax=Nonomuraea terrae TaxID=2530383 RepID=UPI00379E673B
MDAEKLDHPIAEARANLSELLAAVRLLRRVYFLTSRGKPQAAIVPAELGDAVVAAGGVDAAVALLTAAVRNQSAEPSKTLEDDQR